MTIPFNDLRPALAEIRSDIDAAVKRVVDSGVFLNGPEVEAFEDEWATYCGTQYCVACASGTDALMLAVHNHYSTGFDIQANGCRFTDTALDKAHAIDKEPFGIVFQDVNERGMMECTYPGLPTLLYGRQTILISRMTPKAFPVVVDACQAHGWKPTTDAAWSFYPTKNFGCFGDGGALTTNDSEVAEVSREVANDWHSRMSELNAAVLRTKLPHLDRWNAERQAIAEVYYNELPDWAEPVCHPGEPTNHHIFAVLVDRRDELEKHILANGVGVKVHYREPLAELPGAVRWCSRVLSLPCWPGLTPMQVQEVCDVMKGFR